MTVKYQYLCPHCNSSSIIRDAYAEWNEETQKWETYEVYDTFHCNTCEKEFKDPLELEIK